MLIEAEVAKAVIGNTVNMGVAHGFNVEGAVQGAAKIEQGMVTATVLRDEASVHRAREVNNSGSNKPFAKALERGRQLNAKGERYLRGMLGKTGQDKTIEAVMKRGMSSLRAEQAAADTPTPPAAMHDRKQKITRETFKQMTAYLKRDKELSETPVTKPVQAKASQLPQPSQEKIEQASIERGEQITPTGKPIVRAPEVAPPVAKTAAMNNARTPVGLSNTTKSFNYWAQHGALMGGSYVDHAPRLRPNQS